MVHFGEAGARGLNDFAQGTSHPPAPHSARPWRRVELRGRESVRPALRNSLWAFSSGRTNRGPPAGSAIAGPVQETALDGWSAALTRPTAALRWPASIQLPAPHGSAEERAG